MPTISKFYFHDAATTNTGTMPGAGTAFFFTSDTDGDASAGRTAKTADATIGVSETNSVVTATANTFAQKWGHRRFVSAPLAAHTFTSGDGSWTFSFAAVESNTNHNGSFHLYVYAWRPSTGAQVGASAVASVLFNSLTGGTTKTAYSNTGNTGNVTILDGDILVFEISDQFTQSMGTAYTSTFYYDGTTEASTTSCASFVTPPAALTLFTGAAATIPNVNMAPYPPY